MFIQHKEAHRLFLEVTKVLLPIQEGHTLKIPLQCIKTGPVLCPSASSHASSRRFLLNPPSHFPCQSLQKEQCEGTHIHNSSLQLPACDRNINPPSAVNTSPLQPHLTRVQRRQPLSYQEALRCSPAMSHKTSSDTHSSNGSGTRVSLQKTEL